VVAGGGLDFASSTAPVTLAKGKQISVEGVPLLAAGPDKALKFVPTSAAFTLVNPVAAEEEGQAAALATLRLASELTVTTDGVLRVLPGAIFEIAADKTLPLATTADFSLVVEAGGILQFEGAVSPVTAAALAVGSTTIASATASETGVLRADGGNITFLPNSISGSGAGTRLIPLGEETGELTITVDPTPSGGVTLTLTAVDLDLTDGGALVINGFSSTANTVALAAGAVPGKITINNALTGSPLGATDLAQVSSLSGNNEIVRAANGILTTTDGTVEGDLVSISGGLKTVLTFKGLTTTNSNVTIDAELGIGD
jgi:hypothetical protein